MLNSSSSIIPFFNTLDKHISNTAIADIMISANLVTFVSFFWYFLVIAEVTQPAITPVRDATPSGMLTGRPMNVLNVTMLDIPVAMLRLLEQVFSQVSRSDILAYFLYVSLYLSSNLFNPCHLP